MIRIAVYGRVRTSVELAVTSCIGLETCSAGVFEILDDLAVTVP